MKFPITLSIFLVSASFLSCSGNSSTAGNANDSTATADTVAVAVKEEAPEPELLVTPDLTLLEVKGNVKEIKGKEADNYVYGKGAKFDKEGKLTHFGNSIPIDKISNIKRDKDGRLTDFLASEWATVKWDGERPLSMANQYNEFTETETYKYDDKGLISEITCRYQDEIEEIDETKVGKVTYPADAFDSNGNWVKRIVKYPDHTETQIREILYY